MRIQKPTVLDAARLVEELAYFKRGSIEQASCDQAGSRLCLELRNPDAVLEFIVEKKFASLGRAQGVNPECGKKIEILTNYKISDVVMPVFDRIIEIRLEKTDRLGRLQAAKLMLELFPAKGNAFLIDGDGHIKWSLKKRMGKYVLPPKLKKPTVLDIDAADFKFQNRVPGRFSEMIYGLNERDLVNLNIDDHTDLESALLLAKSYTANAVKSGPAWVIFIDTAVIGFSLLPPILLAGEMAQKYETALEMYNSYYSLAAGPETQQEKTNTLIRILEREIKRENVKLINIQKELEKAEGSKAFRKYGELILANVDSIKKGARSVRLLDFDGAAYLEIELDPSMSASANAENYFKRARKAASSVNVLKARLESSKKRLAQLERASVYGNDFRKLESALLQLKLIARETNRFEKKVIKPRLPYKSFRSSSGWEILVGRTNKDNDELTFKIADSNDYWFHAWQAAGSHTILRLPSRNATPDKQTLLEAASLAAHFSKARSSSKVPVAYAQVKYVHKPKKFPPGKVIVDHEKQLIVRPADPRQYERSEDD